MVPASGKDEPQLPVNLLLAALMPTTHRLSQMGGLHGS